MLIKLEQRTEQGNECKVFVEETEFGAVANGSLSINMKNCNLHTATQITKVLQQMVDVLETDGSISDRVTFTLNVYYPVHPKYQELM